MTTGVGNCGGMEDRKIGREELGRQVIRRVVCVDIKIPMHSEWRLRASKQNLKSSCN